DEQPDHGRRDRRGQQPDHGGEAHAPASPTHGFVSLTPRLGAGCTQPSTHRAVLRSNLPKVSAREKYAGSTIGLELPEARSKVTSGPIAGTSGVGSATFHLPLGDTRSYDRRPCR